MRPGGCGPGQHRGLSSRATEAPTVTTAIPSHSLRKPSQRAGRPAEALVTHPPTLQPRVPQEPLAHPRRRGAHYHPRLPIPHLHSLV